MKWDALLDWMTHLGSGRWGAFREAVEELFGSEDFDLQDLCRTLRVALSDLGHADFFVDGTRRWRIRKPALLGVGSSSGEAVLSGGRTRRLVDSVMTAAGAAGLEVAVEDVGVGLSQVRVAGSFRELSDMAIAAEVEYIPNAAALVATQLTPIRDVLARAPLQEEPINWAVRSWSFEAMGWAEGRLPQTAREYSSRYGARRYMVAGRRGKLYEIDKREAVFAAALLRRERVAIYRLEERVLEVPLTAPLPDLFARAACLANGRIPTPTDGRLRFENISPEAGSVLLVSLGQRYPLEGAIR